MGLIQSLLTSALLNAEGRGEASQSRTPWQSDSCNATDTPLQVPTTALSAGEVPEDTAGPFQWSARDRLYTATRLFAGSR